MTLVCWLYPLLGSEPELALNRFSEYPLFKIPRFTDEVQRNFKNNQEFTVFRFFSYA